ncbi:MAG: O-antigen ligase family protein [Caldilineaceae bacterium]
MSSQPPDHRLAGRLSPPPPNRPHRTHLLWLCALVCLLAAGAWLLRRGNSQTPHISTPTAVAALGPGVVARMDSPVFEYGEGWYLSAGGADPREPSDPWTEPAGTMSFAYSGRELALQLAVGDYWGYIFVTIDGAPANRLPSIPGNLNSADVAAGYKPLLAPELQRAEGPTPVWVLVHRADDDGPHTVEVEVWRGWGQIPLRAVAVDALPAPRLPLWPAAAFGLGVIWSLYFGLKNRTRRTRQYPALAQKVAGLVSAVRRVSRVHQWLPRLWPGALLLIGAGVFLDSWLLSDAGLALLVLAALVRPEIWLAALLFGLPFYLYPLPILPGRALNLIEIGVWGGLVLWGIRHWIVPLAEAQRRSAGAPRNAPHLLLALLVSLSLVAALAAQYADLALREWRTVFLAGGGFALLLGLVLTQSDNPARSRQLLINGWLAGGTAVALIALWQFASGQMLIQAEGVARVRGLYGSPNNLALYLERTLAIGIAYFLFRGSHSVNRRARWPRVVKYALLLLPQVAALVLTFSKGALFLGIPALLLVLTGGGAVLLARQGKSLRFLWWLAAIGGVVVLGLLPFLGADRFRLLLDFGAGTTGGLRLNLWRSAWAMALDHPWLGVGPDNFLYAYRSGYLLPAAWQDPNLNHPHNFVLDWWTRLGLPGLILAGAWVGIGVRQLGRALCVGAEPGLALGCLAAVAAALAHGLIDASFALPDLMLVWVLLFSLPTGQYPQSPRPESHC